MTFKDRAILSDSDEENHLEVEGTGVSAFKQRKKAAASATMEDEDNAGEDQVLTKYDDPSLK